MRVRPTLRAVLLAGGFFTASASGLAASGSPGALPPDEALTALRTLAMPSFPQPATGDLQLGDHRWARPGTCADVRAGFHAADAPVPAGSTLADDPFGNIVVQSPYGTTAIMFEDQVIAERCAYSIERTPTVRATAPGLVIADQFSPVACTTLLGFDATLISMITDQGEWTAVVVQPDGSPWIAKFVPGPVAVVSELNDPPPNAIEATGEVTTGEDHVSFVGTSPAGAVSIDVNCTPSQFLQQPVD